MKGVEFVPSDDFWEDIDVLKEFLRFYQADFILIPDNPLGHPKPSSVVSAKVLEDALGVKTIATIGAGGKSRENILSLIQGAKYAYLSGIACVSGDKMGNFNALDVLKIAQEYEFEFKITTIHNVGEKIKKGATHAITQPIFHISSFLSNEIPIFANFMPIFSHSTFKIIAKNQEILGFEIPNSYQNSLDLMETNKNLLRDILCSKANLYLTPLNLKKQLPHLKELFR